MTALHPDLWARVADRLAAHMDAGLGHLLTEDVLRFATIGELVAGGLLSSALASEHRVAGVGSIDLISVPLHEGFAIEFKFPREPRIKNAAVTSHVGELLADLYRLAKVEAYDRWAVQVLEEPFVAHLRRRGDVRLLLDPGEVMELPVGMVASLPKTARDAIAKHDAGRLVRVEGVFSRPVGGLTMQVLRVS